MKYAVIADIHANLPALKAVLADIKTQKCDRIVCLGDLVGYNYRLPLGDSIGSFYQPNACVDFIRVAGIPCVKGNQDEYCSSDEALVGFNPHASEALNWTRAQLGKSNREWLRNLELIKYIDGFCIVHATLHAPQSWGYVFDRLAAAQSFQHQESPVCFFGHTHVPVAFIRDTVVRGGTYSSFKVEPDKQYFVNVGSVGQPRDNNPKAAYATYDLVTQVIELRRVDFEVPAGPGEAGMRVAPGTPPHLTGSNAQAIPNSDNNSRN